jgi:hypothetical protein
MRDIRGHHKCYIVAGVSSAPLEQRVLCFDATEMQGIAITCCTCIAHSPYHSDVSSSMSNPQPLEASRICSAPPKSSILAIAPSRS